MNCCVDQNYNSKRCSLILARMLLIKQQIEKNEFSGNWLVIKKYILFCYIGIYNLLFTPAPPYFFRMVIYSKN